jgi:tetratricopeptide (TPR) repeat protein/tRNA A-37 threonylcarbamoyl transferase component Bud32
MNPDKWNKVKSIVNECLDLPPDQRVSHLESSSAGDAEILAEAASLLDNYAEAGDSFLEGSISHEIIPKRFGIYEVVEQIGEGGMGAVYRAVRESDFQMQVAIKLVRRGMDTDYFLSRFRRERQILAGLEHPNIARLLDGGATVEGLPYLVMEFIDGTPITKYCREKGLAVRERLELFQTVCQAVQHAHQNLVVHRDLKAGNILVTSAGVPKLLDFGIAKLLDESAGESETVTDLAMLTPECASPEQIRGEKITTASDVYSLGVLLFVLLTDEPPYRFVTRTPAELTDLICHAPLKKPSEVRRVHHDLDNITLKAMHRDPARRYSSAEQLAEDVRRNLRSLPILARKDTLTYRSSKFVGRHKAASAVSLLFVISLLAGVAATLWEARRASVQKDLAEQRFRDMRALASSNLFEIYDAIANLPGSAQARNLVLQRGLDVLDKLQSQHPDDRETLQQLATGYQRIAGLEGVYEGPGIGDSRAALASYEKAVQIRSALIKRFPGDVSELKPQVDVLGSYAQSLLITGRTSECLRVGRLMLTTIDQIAKIEPPAPAVLTRGAQARIMLSSVMGGNGSSGSMREFSEAILQDRAAIDTLQHLLEKKNDSAVRAALGKARMLLGLHLGKNRDFEDSLRVLTEIIEPGTAETVWPDSVLMISYNWRGEVFEREGDQKRALGDYEHSLAIAKALAQSDVHNLSARITAYIQEGHIFMQHARLGKPEAGLAGLTELVRSVENMRSADPSQSFYLDLLLVGYGYQAEILSTLGDQPAAQKVYSQALATAEELARNDPSNLEARLSIAKLHSALGVISARVGRVRGARQELDVAQRLVEQALVVRPEDHEALHLSAEVRKAAAGLDRCLEPVSCPAVKNLALPVLLN